MAKKAATVANSKGPKLSGNTIMLLICLGLFVFTISVLGLLYYIQPKQEYAGLPKDYSVDVANIKPNWVATDANIQTKCGNIPLEGNGEYEVDVNLLIALIEYNCKPFLITNKYRIKIHNANYIEPYAANPDGTGIYANDEKRGKTAYTVTKTITHTNPTDPNETIETYEIVTHMGTGWENEIEMYNPEAHCKSFYGKELYGYSPRDQRLLSSVFAHEVLVHLTRRAAGLNDIDRSIEECYAQYLERVLVENIFSNRLLLRPKP